MNLSAKPTKQNPKEHKQNLKLKSKSPQNLYKIEERLDLEGNFLRVRRYSDLTPFFVRVENVVNNLGLILKKRQRFIKIQKFLTKSKIENILSPVDLLITDQVQNGKRTIWKIYESFEYILWNEYYMLGSRLSRKFVVRHFDEKEMLLLSKILVDSLILLFSKGKLPCFINSFVCLKDRKYMLFFDDFKDMRENPVLSFVDFDHQSQILSIKKVIYDARKSPNMPGPKWEAKERFRRLSRRNERKSKKHESRLQRNSLQNTRFQSVNPLSK